MTEWHGELLVCALLKVKRLELGDLPRVSDRLAELRAGHTL